MKSWVLIGCLLMWASWDGFATDYYFHPTQGQDSHSGRSPQEAFQTLGKIKDLDIKPGDRILLAAGSIFDGMISLENRQATKEQPIRIETYGSGPQATINAQGFLAGILIQNSRFIQVQQVRITGNGSGKGQNSGDMRVGVLVRATGGNLTENIILQDLDIDQVYFENPGFQRGAGEVKSANGTQKYGWGIRLIAEGESLIEQVLIQRVKIQDVSHTGIKLTGSGRLNNISQIQIYDNQLQRTGGPGIQMSNAKFVHVRGNVVNQSGNTNDSRKWGRGSGLWTWSCAQILIEKNQFLNANGPGDSAGAHIDYNCDHVVLQYNFSANNAGGFCEILGNNYNCVYRYNISVNDGHREKGKNGAFQEGKIYWLSGYQGEKKPRKAPVNSYFYNNTIYVKADQPSKIAIDNRSQGILIANNIFHLEGPVSLVAGDQYKPDDLSGKGDLSRTFFQNNLFLSAQTWPSNIPIQDAKPLYGKMNFVNPGGLQPEDYKLVDAAPAWRGIPIPALPGDAFQVMQSLQPAVDFFGQPITGLPPMGAVMPNPGVTKKQTRR